MALAPARRSGLVAVLALALLCASPAIQAAMRPGGGQAGQKPFEPKVGQAGKDVVWVPTPQALVDKMLDMAGVTASDYVIDLGSGDGRTVITAARRGARALGIEYNPEMVALSLRNATEAGLGDRALFRQADLFETDLTIATVVTMFLLPDINLKLRPKLLDLKAGTRVVSNSFTMGEWEADRRETVTEDCQSYCTALLWIVPAKVNGTWRLGDQTLTLNQQFQTLGGTLGTESVTGRLSGESITFTAGGTTYTGRVTGPTLEGTREGAATGPWRATRGSGVRSWIAALGLVP
jgi:Methyltransferase domain